MKRNITRLSILSIALALSSCTDLDVDIKSQFTEIPDNERAAEAASAEVYSAYRGALGRDHWMAQTISSDEAVSVAMGSDYYDGGVYRQLHLHNWNPDHNMFETMWNAAMNGIVTANTILSSMEDAESVNAAPIRAMRAFYHFLLMDNFGAVPIIQGRLTVQPDRSPRPEVCRFIESELLAVVDKLPTDVNANTYGKATKYMAEALLAKLYLNWAVYTSEDVANYSPSMNNEKLQNVVAMCDAIIASQKFDLNGDFLSKFRPDNGPHIKDFIFAMPYDKVRQQGMTYARFWIPRSSQKQFADLPQSVGGILRVVPEFLDKFNLEGDDRNAVYIGGPQYYWENYTENRERPFMITTSKKGIDQDYSGADADEPIDWQLELSREIQLRPDGAATLNVGNDQKGRAMGYRSVKFFVDQNLTSAHARNQSNDVPIFRYADVLLMKAEAILRGASPTNGDSPLSLINQIRAYVHAEALATAPTLEDLLDERAREFTDESWRRNDLIRFGKFEDKWGFRDLYTAGYTEKYRRIFPMPTNVLNLNTIWQQNPGYSQSGN